MMRLMRIDRVSMTITFSLLLCGVVGAAEDEMTNINVSKTDGTIETGWVVQIPAGSSDFFNVHFTLGPATPAAERSGILRGATGFSPGVALVGFYHSQPGLPGTPDLANPVVQLFNPAVGPTGYVDLPDTPLGLLPDGDYHLVMQFPPGTTTMSVGGDSDGVGGGGAVFNPFDSSAWSLDGYATPAIPMTLADFNMNLVIDPDNAQGGQLRLTNTIGTPIGDWSYLVTTQGRQFGMSFFGPHPAGDLWMIFMAFAGAPIGSPLGGILPTIPDPAGDWLRVGGLWPPGLGGMTFDMISVWGSPGVGVGMTNTVTVQVL